MKIQTNKEPLRFRNINYLIDPINGLAFVPHQIRDAGICYQQLLRRGKINTQTLLWQPEKKMGKFDKFSKWVWEKVGKRQRYENIP